VKSAEDRVTFVVQKRRDADDHQSVAGTTISSVSRDWALPYTPDRSGQSTVEGGESKDESTKRRMVEDGSLVIIKESTITEPIPVKANESWKLSGAIVVVVKMKSSSHNPGLRLGTKETSTGRVLHIADINPSSPFTNTPLRVGDVVISINNVDLQDNADVVDAYSALGKSKDEIAVVARKSEESLTEFLEDRKARVKPYAGVKSRERVFEATPVVEPSNSHQISPAERPIGSTLKKIEVTSLPDEMPAPSLCDTSFEFDEESYGASLNGYNSSKLIHIAKSYPQESLGLDLSLVSTEWGALLTIVRISPYCKAASTGIRVGDAILAINGVDFRENANVEQAQSVIKQARKDVDIEIQQLSLRPTTIPEKQTNFNDGITILESNNVGVVRTRTFDSNDDFLTQSETLKIAGKVDKEDPYNSSASMRSLDIPMVRRTQSSTPKEDDRSSLALQRTKKFRKVWITVVKEHAREIVGISFTTIQNKLIVTDVSPSGLLRGAPVLPGDTILSINGVNFSRDPNAEYAFALVVRAPKELLFEVLKTGYVIGVDKVEPKSCLRRLACNRSRKDQGVMYLEKEDDDGETLSMSMIE
jgi:C-terminal processing protease CtpA/Prc